MYEDALAGLTPEELQALKGELDSKLVDPNASQVSMSLPDGTTVTGTQEEVQGKLNQFYADQRAAPATEPQQHSQNPTAEDRPSFDQKQFLTKAEAGFDGAMDYYYDTKYGYNPHAMITLLATALNKVQSRIGELDYEKTASTIDGFHNSDKNRQVLDKIIQEKNWDNSTSSYRDAYHIAQGRNMLEAAPAPAKAPFPVAENPNRAAYNWQDDNGQIQAPPRLNGGSYNESEQVPDTEQFFHETRNLSTDKVGDLLREMENKYRQQ